MRKFRIQRFYFVDLLESLFDWFSGARWPKWAWNDRRLLWPTLETTLLLLLLYMLMSFLKWAMSQYRNICTNTGLKTPARFWAQKDVLSVMISLTRVLRTPIGFEGNRSLQFEKKGPTCQDSFKPSAHVKSMQGTVRECVLGTHTYLQRHLSSGLRFSSSAKLVTSLGGNACHRGEPVWRALTLAALWGARWQFPNMSFYWHGEWKHEEEEGKKKSCGLSEAVNGDFVSLPQVFFFFLQNQSLIEPRPKLACLALPRGKTVVLFIS